MSKLVNLSDSAYTKLEKMKNGRSFSKVVLELVEKSNVGNKEELMNVLKKMKGNEIDVKKIKSLDEYWKKWTKRYV